VSKFWCRLFEFQYRIVRFPPYTSSIAKNTRHGTKVLCAKSARIASVGALPFENLFSLRRKSVVCSIVLSGEDVSDDFLLMFLSFRV